PAAPKSIAGEEGKIDPGSSMTEIWRSCLYFLNATEVSPITSWVERNYTQVGLAGRRTSEVGAGGAVRQHRDSKHQPFTIALLTTFEAINAFPRTESRSPGVVSNKTEPSVTNGATLGTLDDL